MNLFPFLCKMNFFEKTRQVLALKEWTPIQQQLFSSFEAYENFTLYAETGSGKTLAYLLPVFDQLNRGEPLPFSTLILAPTRELALQIEQVAKSLKSAVAVTTCYGGHSMKTEVRNLQAKPNVVIGTPGRLADHLRRGTVEFNNFSYLIIDEFDKCLQIGFLEEIRVIYSACQPLKKAIYCSATQLDDFPDFVQLHNHKTIDLLASKVPVRMDFKQIDSGENQLSSLCRFLDCTSPESCIVFLNFRDDVDALATYLESNDYAVTAYHGGMEQDERERALIKFRNGSCPILICTDLGARGLDVSDVKHVLHYQLPEKEDAFVHRNGRTARMNAEGIVYWFKGEHAAYDLPSAELLHLPKDCLYKSPEWTTVYFSAGKKDKINKIDLVGFICQKGRVDKADIGMISVLDTSSYVAIRSYLLPKILVELRKHKIKNQKVRIAISK